jgi:hypothetical protein
MSLAYHFGESSAEKVENWPADKFNSWAQYSAAIGGVTPITLESLGFMLWKLALWAAIPGEKELIEFDELFRHRPRIFLPN